MALTSTTCGDHLARKSWREASWDALILHVVHKSLGPEEVASQGAVSAQHNSVADHCGANWWSSVNQSFCKHFLCILKEYLDLINKVTM